MHNAPSVSYPVGRFVWWLGVQWGITGLLAIAAVVLSLVYDQWAVSLAIGVAGLVTWMVVWRAWHTSPRGHLAWVTGVSAREPGIWYWRDDGDDVLVALVELSLVVMLQSRMCVSFSVPNRGRRTVWLARECAPVHWYALRQAVWASRGAPLAAADRAEVV